MKFQSSIFQAWNDRVTDFNAQKSQMDTRNGSGDLKYPQLNPNFIQIRPLVPKLGHFSLDTATFEFPFSKVVFENLSDSGNTADTINDNWQRRGQGQHDHECVGPPHGLG